MRAPRAQCDRIEYKKAIHHLLHTQGVNGGDNLHIIERSLPEISHNPDLQPCEPHFHQILSRSVDDILLEGSGTDRRCAGILTAEGEPLRARSVVVTTGEVHEYGGARAG